MLIRDKVINWNNKYPIDLWFRRKYNIPFGSEQHKSMSLLDMLFEFIEDWEIEKIGIQSRNKQTEEDDELLDSQPTSVIKTSKEEEQRLYDELDLDEYNKKQLKEDESN